MLKPCPAHAHTRATRAAGARRGCASWVVVTACLFLFVADTSLLSLVLPLGIFGFALMAPHTPRAFWQVRERMGAQRPRTRWPLAGSRRHARVP